MDNEQFERAKEEKMLRALKEKEDLLQTFHEVQIEVAAMML